MRAGGLQLLNDGLQTRSLTIQSAGFRLTTPLHLLHLCNVVTVHYLILNLHNLRCSSSFILFALQPDGLWDVESV